MMASSRSSSTALAVDVGRAVARQLVADDHERARLVVAHGGQTMAGENERHRGGLRRRGLGVAHQRRGHEARVMLDVEPARDLDLLHLLAGRDGDAEQPLDQLVLAGRGIDQIEPDRVVGHLLARATARRSSEWPTGTYAASMSDPGSPRAGAPWDATKRPGEPLDCASLGPIAGIPQQKMAGGHRARTGPAPRGSAYARNRWRPRMHRGRADVLVSMVGAVGSDQRAGLPRCAGLGSPTR